MKTVTESFISLFEKAQISLLLKPFMDSTEEYFS